MGGVRAARVVFPLLVLAACAPTAEPPPPKAEASSAERNVILFLGDSLTAGYGVALEAAFPALLDDRWRELKLPVRARNAGVSGATTAGILETLDWTLAPDVKLVFVCVGGNDGLRGLPIESTRKNLGAIIEKAKARGVSVVLAGMKLPPNYGAEYAGGFERLYPELARRHGLKLMPFLLEGVGGQSAFNLPDGIHPNEAGHRRVAESVHAFLSGQGLLR